VEEETKPLLAAGPKSERKDLQFTGDVIGGDYKNTIFIRLTAVKRRFNNVDFRFCTFDACYIRSCEFDSCKFTGCRFVGTNFSGTSFVGCNFDYAIFERTDIDGDILDTGRPSHENLAMRFSRSLRLNFQQMGDVDAVNRAIRVELDATRVHLYRAWKGNSAYHQKKYKGLVRVKYYFRWLRFRTFEIIWGNGESVLRLSISLVVVMLLLAVVEVAAGADVGKGLIDAPQVFLGVANPMQFPGWSMALIVVIRLVFFGMFTSTLIKRLSRR
jgi:hypothetical protein